MGQMPQYGVWLQEGVRSGTGDKARSRRTASDAPEDKLIQFVWRGTADDREAAVRSALTEWKRRYGPRAPGGMSFIQEILPDDSGYEP